MYATADREVVDGHKHFVEAGGHSDHHIFVKGLISDDFLQPTPKGPKNSAPQQPRRAKAKAKPSESLKRMLAAPELPSQPKASEELPSAAAELPAQPIVRLDTPAEDKHK